MSASSVLNATPECEIVTTRTFRAARHLVFKAWSDPVHLKAWWGPKGFTNTFNTFDFRVGGKWNFIMHGPDKGNYVNDVTFIAIREPELLVWDRQSKPFFQVEVLFESVSTMETKVIFKQKFKTVEECEKLRKYVPEKNEENMDRLQDELNKMIDPQ
jgi:uncharacterized protein YndB with AHSA1/START domain